MSDEPTYKAPEVKVGKASDFRVGDIVDFPMHEQGRAIRVNASTVEYTQGMPGNYRITAIKDGALSLERLPDEGS